MNRIVRVLACAAIGAVVVLLPLIATAHEEREVADGRYNLVVGFIDEPAYVGEKNGLILEVADLSAPATPAAEGEEDHGGSPVLGLAETLQAEVIYGDQTMELELVPAFDHPGTYYGYFFPMADGDYTFRVFGDIEGAVIDESFTSSPEGFASVEPREPLEFPKEESSRVGVDRW